MPDNIKVTAHPQVGPTLSATTWVGLPVVGATSTFVMKVSRMNEPVSGASVTLRVMTVGGAQIYPPSGAITIPESSMPGSYMYTSALTNIFTDAGSTYVLKWLVTVSATQTDPQLILPVTQRVIAQEP